MAIRQACSYIVRIKTPRNPTEYEAILITIQQKKRNLVSKTLEDLQIDGNRVVMRLNQEETRPFEPAVPAFLQIRCYASEYDAPGSKPYPLEVWPALDDQILGGD